MIAECALYAKTKIALQILLLPTCLFISSTSLANSTFDSLRNNAKLNHGEQLLVFIGETAECEKCILTLKSDYSWLKKAHNLRPWKSIVLLEADRNIHCDAFTARYPWAGPVVLIAERRMGLGLRPDVRLAVFDVDGQLLKQWSYTSFLNASPSDIALYLAVDPKALHHVRAASRRL
jgi:hypothetical protein